MPLNQEVQVREGVDLGGSRGILFRFQFFPPRWIAQ